MSVGDTPQIPARSCVVPLLSLDHAVPSQQYTLNGRRHYVEYEGLANPRGAAHEARILANDPNAGFTLRLVP